jgi:hypothetical protein
VDRLARQRVRGKMVTVSSDSVIVGGVTGEWTLAELVWRAAQALADADVRAPNGRVTQLPDARMIRWYATIGIVDKPSGFRGRTALYGHRHLLQLVAIKRLQAQGLPLAEIQARLTGATAAALREIAGLTESAAGSTVDALNTVDTVEPLRPRFWAARPAPAAEAPAAEAGPAEAPAAEAPAVEAGPAEAGSSDEGHDAEARAAGAPAALVRTAALKSPQGTLHGVGLAGGAMLLVPANVHPDQVAAIRRAAQPLLEYLSILGLLNPDEGAHA